MICISCSNRIYDDDLRDDWHDLCLGEFKDKVYELFGFHPDTSPDFIYNEILRLRQIARESKP